MSEVVADLLEREPFGQQMVGAGMAQRVWSVVRQLEVKRLQPKMNHCSQTTNRQWLKGWKQPEEDFASVCLWARFSQIKQDGFAHFPHQWILMLTALLSPSQMNELSLPIQILKFEAADLAAAKAIDGQQGKDGAIPNVTVPLLPDASDQLSHLSP